MRKDNTPNYNTPYSNIQHFKDYIQNVDRERDDIAKVDRQQIQDHDSDYEMPNEFRQNYNRVSSKYDIDSKKVVSNKLDSANKLANQKPAHKFKFSNDEVNPNHFFKNNTEVVESKHIMSFENFGTDLGYDPQTPKTNASLSKNSDLGDDYEEMEGCGCCDECTGGPDCDCCDDCTCNQDYDYDDEDDVKYEHSGEIKSYMFFGNLKSINRYCKQLLKLDQDEVNDLLNDGHNWAEDHVSVCKELISHVNNFLMNKSLKEHFSVSGVEHGGGQNYMFFANLENICEATEELLELDEAHVDEILEHGHDWAEDHISAAKENLNQVFDWLRSELKF